MARVYIFLSLLLLHLAGCGTVPIQYLPQSLLHTPDAPILEDEVVIFGRILFTENGELQVPYGFQTRPRWTLTSPANEPGIVDAYGRKASLWIPLRADEDGLFVYVIPAGRYRVASVKPFYYTPFIYTALEIEVRTPGKAYYLGDLEVDYDSTRWLGGMWGNYIHSLNYLEVVDRSDRAFPEFAAGPGRSRGLPVGKALMVRVRGGFPTINEEDGWFMLRGGSGPKKYAP